HRHTDVQPTNVDKGVTLIFYQVPPADLKVAFIHALTVYIFKSLWRSYDARPEQCQDINNKFGIGLTLPCFFQPLVVDLHHIPLDVLHQLRMAIPPEEAEGQFQRSLVPV